MDVAPHVDSLLRQEFLEVVEANHGDSLAEPPEAGTTRGGKRRSRNGIHVEPDAGFDTVVCTHTLEHIPQLHESVQELRRVGARRLIIIVPCQRYYRYTIDYHLHFFPSAAPLAHLVAGDVRAVDGDWFCVTSL